MGDVEHRLRPLNHPMSSWSKNRKSLYGGIVIVFLAVVVVLPIFLHYYKAPTCFDGVKNGSEQGIDCGGSCSKLCQSSFLSADVAWTRFEEVAPSLYNVAAYIVNQNTTGEAKNAPYRFMLYDKDGLIITDQSGVVTLPPHRNTLAFQGAVNVGARIPARALFEFTSAPNWLKRVDPLAKISIGSKDYTEDASGSSLMVTLKNNDIYPLANVSVYVVLYNKDGNALGFSKTSIDEIPANGSSVAPFTWPRSRDGKVISIDVLPVQE